MRSDTNPHPAFLNAWPHFLARWFALRQRCLLLARWQYCAGLGFLLLCAWTLQRGQEQAQLAIAWLNTQSLLLAGFALLLAATTLHRRRERLQRDLSADWLGALPIGRGKRRWTLALLLFWPVLGQAGLLLFVLALTLLFTPVHAAELAGPLRALLLGYAAGALLDGALALRPPRRRAIHPGFFATQHRLKDAASLRPLGDWPLVQAQLDLHPRALSRLVLPLLCVIPMGTGFLQGLAALLGWAAALYALQLLKAVRRSAGEAARWLRSLPLRRRDLLLQLLPRALLQLCLAILVTAAALGVLGLPLPGLSVAALLMLLGSALLTVLASLRAFASATTG